jgi:hypothetical protein
LANILLYVFNYCNKLIRIVCYGSYISNSYCVVGIGQVFEPLHLVEFFGLLPRSSLLGTLNLSEDDVSFY